MIIELKSLQKVQSNVKVYKGSVFEEWKDQDYVVKRKKNKLQVPGWKYLKKAYKGPGWEDWKRPDNVGKKEEKQVAIVRTEILEKGLQRYSFRRLKTSR